MREPRTSGDEPPSKAACLAGSAGGPHHCQDSHLDRCRQRWPSINNCNQLSVGIQGCFHFQCNRQCNRIWDRRQISGMLRVPACRQRTSNPKSRSKPPQVPDLSLHACRDCRPDFQIHRREAKASFSKAAMHVCTMTGGGVDAQMRDTSPFVIRQPEPSPGCLPLSVPAVSATLR